MAFGGVVLKSGQTVLRLLQFFASVLILGVFSYFLAYLATHHVPEARYIKAVEGISGAAVIYTFFAALLTCFIGGLTFSAILAIFLDICFVGGFVAVAILTRNGTGSCNGIVNTPLGTGDSTTGNGVNFSASGGGNNNITYHPNLGRACKLEKAVFAVAIINVILFLISIFFEIGLMRHHQRERRYGPSPSNNYTAGSRGRFGFGRRKNRTTRDAELATVGAAGLAAEKHHHDHNQATGVTGNGRTANF